MSYNISLLSTIEDCEALLNIARKEKEKLEYKKLTLERKISNTQEKSVQISTDLQAIIGEITTLDQVIAGLPEGSIKKEMLDRKKRAEYRKYLLENRSENYGIIALLETQMQIEAYLKYISEVDIFIQEVNSRKTGL